MSSSSIEDSAVEFGAEGGINEAWACLGKVAL